MSKQGEEWVWRLTDRKDAGHLGVMLTKGDVSIAIVLPRPPWSANPPDHQRSIRTLLREVTESGWRE